MVRRTDILQPTIKDDPQCLSYHELTSSVSNFKVRDRSVYVNDLRGSGHVFWSTQKVYFLKFNFFAVINFCSLSTHTYFLDVKQRMANVLVDEWKTNLMSLAILFHLLCAQHVSDINISIFRSLRLGWWITTSVVLFSVRCVLELLLRLVIGGVRFSGWSCASAWKTTASVWKTNTTKY